MKHMIFKTFLLAFAMTGTVFAADLNQEWLQTVKNYYEQQKPKVIKDPLEVFCIYQFSDDFKGDVCWSYNNHYFDIDFEYGNSNSGIQLSIDTDNGDVEFDIDIYYDDETAFRMDMDLYANDNIGDVLSDISAIDPFMFDDESAFENHPVKEDVALMYARFKELAEAAFSQIPDINCVSDSGVLLKDSSVDPTTHFSFEKGPVSNEHHFVNGICTDDDCTVTWKDHITAAMAIMDEYLEDEPYSFYGSKNKYLLEYSDYNRFFLLEDWFRTSYHSLEIDRDKHGNIFVDFDIDFTDMENLEVNYYINQVYHFGDDDNDITRSAYHIFHITTSPEELLEVLSSKEKLMEAGRYATEFVGVFGEKESYIDEISSEEATSIFEENDVSLITKEDVCDKLIDEYPNYLLSINYEMSVMGTSLKDAGIHIDTLL